MHNAAYCSTPQSRSTQYNNTHQTTDHTYIQSPNRAQKANILLTTVDTLSLYSLLTKTIKMLLIKNTIPYITIAPAFCNAVPTGGGVGIVVV